MDKNEYKKTRDFIEAKNIIKDFINDALDGDINNLKIYRPGCGTNMDAAVRGFSKKREVNKIVFTDGYEGVAPKKDLKDINVIWLVYENRDFHPCCGKVIQIFDREFQNLSLRSKETCEDELTM